MNKFQDLNLEHKVQLVLNLRMQALLSRFIAATQELSVEEVFQLFYETAVKDVFALNETEINEHLVQLDREIESKGGKGGKVVKTSLEK